MFGFSRTASALCLGTLLVSQGGCAFLSGMTSSAGSAGSTSASAPSPSASNEPAEDTFASAPTSAPAPTTAAAPEPPRPVSVKLRNGCSETVKVFFGEKPKFGSGTYSSLSSNSSTHHSFMPGDMFWIVDEGQNGLSSVTVAENTHEIEVRSGCTSLSTR